MSVELVQGRSLGDAAATPPAREALDYLLAVRHLCSTSAMMASLKFHSRAA
jgi:hypothetical protein